MENLKRKIEYMRISLTENCNLRCQYCMDKDQKFIKEQEISVKDVKKIVEAFALMGGKKIRVTGGEPLIRNDIESLVEEIGKVSGIKEIALTTNGLLLDEKLPSLLEKGLTSVNISLDSLNEERYKEITRGGDLKRVLKSIESAAKTSLKVKINAVPIKNVNDHEIVELANLSRKYPIDVRFIELMPIGLGKKFEPILKDEILGKISQVYEMVPCEKIDLEGPAKYFKLPESMGRVGYISAISEEFCSSCNRIRVTSKGFLKLCLHWNKGIDLTPYLDEKTSPEELKNIILQALENKPEHHLMKEKIADQNVEIEKMGMFQIGG